MSHSQCTMLRSTKLFCVLSFAFATQGCDVGGKTIDPAPIEPSSLEIGDDTDRGAEDDQGPTPVELHGKLHVTGTELRDANDQRVQLKGVSSMWLNWEDDGYAENLTGLKWMRNNWNLSLIRAAMGVEPEYAYLSVKDPTKALPEKAKAQVIQIVDNAIAAGVYVLIDWHAHEAHLHTAEAVAFFTEMATKYAGVPNVLYEPFNEPLEIAWSTVLKPYHEAVVSAIRAVDSEAVIVLGTPRWSQDVDVAAADPLVGKNLMYTLHFYSCTHKGTLINKAKLALRRGAPLFVTEWGATGADGGTKGEVCQVETQAWMDFMNPLGISWAAWKFDDCNDSTCFLVADAPLEGGWTSGYLRGQGLYLRARLQE